MDGIVTLSNRPGAVAALAECELAEAVEPRAAGTRSNAATAASARTFTTSLSSKTKPDQEQSMVLNATTGYTPVPASARRFGAREKALSWAEEGDRGGDAMEESPARRICSLLPSATEIVYALGIEDRLVAVTHECD